MNLLINVFLTNSGGGYYHRGLLPSSNKVDIFKYMLSSFSVMYNWDWANIYFELDEPYKDRETELINYIVELFDDCSLTVSSKRLFTPKDWRKKTDLILEYNTDNLICFFCNHDHIFIDNNLDYFSKGIDILKNDNSKYKSLYPTHQPELMTIIAPPCLTEKEQGYASSEIESGDGVQIINSEILKHWFIDNPPQENFGKTDGKVKTVKARTYVPLKKELIRHFDGYNCPVCTPLTIPPGFFDNNIKIRYGYDDWKEDCVNINPLLPYRRDIQSGTDLKITLEDIPYFWRDKISDVDVNKQYPEEFLVEAARESYLEQCTYFKAPPSTEARYSPTRDYFE